MPFFKKIKLNRGFTLLEIVLYLAIVGVLLVAVVNFHFTMSNTGRKLSGNVDVENSRRVAMNAVNYLVRNADGLLKDANEALCSDLVSDPPVLALYFDNDTYLPGTCVQNGGGVRLTVSTTISQLVLNCYPNISNNGQYNACNTTSYPLDHPHNLTFVDTWIHPDLFFLVFGISVGNDQFLYNGISDIITSNWYVYRISDAIVVKD